MRNQTWGASTSKPAWKNSLAMRKMDLPQPPRITVYECRSLSQRQASAWKNRGHAKRPVATDPGGHAHGDSSASCLRLGRRGSSASRCQRIGPHRTHAALDGVSCHPSYELLDYHCCRSVRLYDLAAS